MESIQLNHWYVGDNHLSISLMDYHASIIISQKNNIICYQVIITDSNQKEIKLDFNTLEESVSFVENVVAHSRKDDNIIENYKNRNKQKTYRKNQYETRKKQNRK